MRWDEEADVVVVGSGMAGCSAALAAVEHGLKTIVLEKGDKAGGGTTYSYGGLWIGNTHLAQQEGYEDSREETIASLRFLGAGYEVEENLLAYVDKAPEALSYFCDVGIPFQLVHGLPDHYYDKAPGSKPEGRMIEVPLISGFDLGDWREKVDISPYVPMGATFEESINWGGHGNVQNWDQDLLRERKERDMRGFGAGLAATFIKALLDREVPIELQTAADRLVVEDGRVVGVIANSEERGEIALRARDGVVLAAGGYESNPELVKNYEDMLEWESMFPDTLTGDALIMASEIGAMVHLVPKNMAIFLGFSVPSPEPNGSPTFRLAGINELSYPHTLVVNEAGERFADESYFQSMLNGLRYFDVWTHTFPNLPCYLILDSQYTSKYPFCALPVGEVPDWVEHGDTLEELAGKLGVDANNLSKTAERFNGFAAKGVDEDHQRGEAAWAQYYTGDLTQSNPNLGSVEKGPFYGVKLIPSGISSAGLLTDVDGQVVNQRGKSIEGLYASGNTSSYIDYGAGYQAGLSLGRGMTFSYLAVKHMVNARANLGVK